MRTEHAYDGSGVCMLCHKSKAEDGECKDVAEDREAEDE